MSGRAWTGGFRGEFVFGLGTWVGQSRAESDRHQRLVPGRLYQGSSRLGTLHWHLQKGSGGNGCKSSFGSHSFVHVTPRPACPSLHPGGTRAFIWNREYGGTAYEWTLAGLQRRLYTALHGGMTYGMGEDVRNASGTATQRRLRG